MEVGKFKEENFNGAWYVQGQTPTAEFTSFVDTYLNQMGRLCKRHSV